MPNLNNTVSVVIPTYNCADFILEAINSVICQTYSNIELIIVDDGSTDETSLILLPYVNSNKIIYIYQDNAGPAAARNRGISIASGDYIAFLDSDDVWHKTFVEKLYNTINNSSFGLVYCGTEFVDDKLRVIHKYCRKVNFYDGNVLLQLFCEHFILTPSVLIKKDCFDDIGLFCETLRVGEDYELLLRLASKYRVGYIKDKLFFRRVLPNSLSRLDFKKDAINDLNTLELFVKKNPLFYEENKNVINIRLAQCYFDLAYGCLEKGENLFPFKCLIKSINYRLTKKAIINILYCALPYNIRNILKFYA